MPRFPDLPCAGCGKLMWRGRTSRPAGEALCQPCIRASRQHGTLAMYRGEKCKCQPCKDAQSLAMRVYSAMVLERDGLTPSQKARPPRGLPCTDCGAALPTGGRSATPRCNECHASHRRMKARALSRRRSAQLRLQEAAKGNTHKRRWPFVGGICGHCDQPFIRRGAPSSYCSDRCRRKDKGGGGYVTRRQRLAIYERDSWICQLCLEPVEQDLHYLDNWAPSLDHIECQSWALVPDHSPGNLRLAHRWCNSVRGDETYYNAGTLAA